MLSKNIENKSATNQPAVMFAVNVTWYRCVQRYPVARYTNGTRTQGCQVMFTAKITAIYFVICIVTVIFSNLFQDTLSKNIENKSAKKQQFAVDFLDFWMLEVWFSVILEARGLFLESRGPIVRISEIVVIFSALRLRKTSPILKQIWTSSQLSAVLFFDVFSSACFWDFLWF